MALQFNADWSERTIPWHSRLQVRFVIGVLIIFTVILGAGATFMLDFEVESVQKRRIEVAKQLGNVLNNTLGAEMVKKQLKGGENTDLIWDNIQQLTDKMREASGALRIELMSQEGEVLVGTDFSLQDHEYNKSEDPECAGCHVHGATEFPSIVIQDEQQKNVLRTITPISMERSCVECHEEQTNFLGMISIDFDYTPIKTENDQRRLRFILMVLSTGGILFLAIYIMIRRQILTPIEVLMEASRHLARGQYDARLEVLKQNEIGRLGQTFNHVASEIQKAHEILELENENNYQSAITDGMTGFRNKAYGEKALREAISNTHECSEPLSLLMVDLDHFKHVNDTYGHLAGDRVLKSVSRRIRHILHYSDTPVRYGGEEFMVILANTDRKGLETVGERLRKNIEEKPFVIDDNGVEIKVTTSVGGSICFKGDRGIEALIERADNALYQAKGSGRNRLVIIEFEE